MRTPTLSRSVGRWLLVVAAAVAVLLVGLELTEREASEDAAASESEPAAVEPLAGTGLSRVRLSPTAAERLGLETAPVLRKEDHKVVPYSSILYDAEGNTWVYRSVGRLTFVRAPIEIASIRGREVLLSDGPKAGVEVASVAVAELYGTEFEVDH